MAVIEESQEQLAKEYAAQQAQGKDAHASESQEELAREYEQQQQKSNTQSTDERYNITHPEAGHLPGVAKPHTDVQEESLAKTLLGGEHTLSPEQRKTSKAIPAPGLPDPVEDFKEGSRIMTDFGAKVGRGLGHAYVEGLANQKGPGGGYVVPPSIEHPLTPGQVAEQHPTAYGVAGGLGSALGGMALDPTNWALAATGAEAGPVLSKLASAAFAAKMGKDTIEGAKQLGAEWDTLTPAQRAERITQLGLQDVFTGLAGSHAVTGENGAIDLTRRGAGAVHENIVKPTIRGASSALAKTASVSVPAIGAGIGTTIAAEAGIPHPYMVGGAAGGAIGRAITKPVVSFLERGKTFGMAPEEASVARLKERATASAKDLADAQAALDDYRASHEQGVEAPEDILKEYEKAKAKADEDRFHLEGARERLDASRRPKPSVPVAEQPITPESIVKPQAEPAAQKPIKPINVKRPGEIQPETFPQEPKPRPEVPGESETLSLPGDEGVRVGKPKALPAIGEQKLLPERASAIQLSEGDSTSQPHNGLGRAFTEGAIDRVPTRGEVIPPLQESLKPSTTSDFPEVKVERKPITMKELEPIEKAVRDSVGGAEPLKRNVALRDQLSKEPVASEEEQPLSSDPRKHELLKAKASPDQVQELLSLTNVELRQLAVNLGEDMGTKVIGRAKGTAEAGTHVAPSIVFKQLLEKHSPTYLVKAVERGKHLPSPEGTPIPPPAPKSGLGNAIAKPTQGAEGKSTKGLGRINVLDEAAESHGEGDQYKKAVQLVRDHNRGSAVLIQRSLKIPFAQAVEFLDRMEEDGIVGPAKGAGPRDVIPTVSGGSQGADYEQLFKEALGAGPAWTPDNAKPVVSALNKVGEFEARGSVAEGRSTDNDLDLWQKSGRLSDAHPALKKLGFEFSHKSPHGEVWVKGSQHLDLWDSEHEPKRGLGGTIQ